MLRAAVRATLLLVGLLLVVVVGRAALEPPPDLAGLERPASPEGPPRFFLEPREPSLAAIGLRASEATLSAMLREMAPPELRGVVDDPAPSPIVDDVLEWRVRPSDLEARARQGALALDLRIDGDARLRGAMGGGADGAIGQLLGALTGAGAGRIDAPAEIAARARVVARPELTADWRAHPGLGVVVEVEKAIADIRALGGLDLSDFAQSAIDRQTAAAIEQIDAQMAADPRLEQAAARAWARLAEPVRFSIGAAEAALTAEPITPLASQPRFAGGIASMRIGLESELAIALGVEPRAPVAEPTPLPPLALGDAAELAHARLEPKLALGWDALEALVNDAAKDRWLPLGEDAAWGEVKLLEIDLEPSGEAIWTQAAIELRGRAAGLLGDQALVWLEARPSIFASSDGEPTLRLSDARLTIDPIEPWGDRLWRVASPWAQGRLERGIAIPLGDALNGAKEALAARRIHAQGWTAAVEVDAGALRVRELAVREEALYVAAAFEGAIDVEILDIPLAPLR